MTAQSPTKARKRDTVQEDFSRVGYVIGIY